MVAHHTDWANEFTLGELFGLADKLTLLRDEQAGSARAIYPVSELAERCGSKNMARVAVQLCGGFHQNGVWIDEGTQNEAPVILDFEDWIYDD